MFYNKMKQKKRNNNGYDSKLIDCSCLNTFSFLLIPLKKFIVLLIQCRKVRNQQKS